MKKLLCVIPALLLFVMIGAPNARADSYTPTLTCAPSPAGGSSDFGCYYLFSYTAPDVSFPSPTVQVMVSDTVYDVTLATADGPTDSYFYEFLNYTGVSPTGLIAYGELVIDDLTAGTTNTATDFIGTGDTSDDVGDGTLTFSPVSAAAPEPAPILLMLLGAGLIFFMRKRFMLRIPGTA